MINNIKKLLVTVGAIKNKFFKNIFVLLDITNGCNLRCAFCTRNNNNVVQMKTAEVEIILGKLGKHVSSLQLSCAWEYSIAKNAAEIIHLIGKYKIPQTSIYTNGNIFTDDIAEALIAAQFNNFVFSVGEARKETYEKLRKGGSFEKVLTNIRKLDRLKKERNSALPRICANLTLVRSNIEELVEFVDLANELNIQEITGRHLILNKGLDMSSEVILDKVYANGIIDEAAQKANGYGIKFFVPTYEDTLQLKSCRAPWQQLYISSNGDVSVCPRIHQYSKIGNLLTESLENIISGNGMADLRRQFTEYDFVNPVCDICMNNRETESDIDQGF